MKFTTKRVYRFSNQWTYEKTVYLLPSISVSLVEHCLDISFLWFKFYTFIESHDSDTFSMAFEDDIEFKVVKNSTSGKR